MRILLTLLFSISLLLPLAPAEASLVPCGQNNDDPTTTTVETDRCKLCHIVSGIAGLINYTRDIMTFIALVVLVGMGILYIVSAGNEGMMTTAKGGIKAALIGFTIILTAWIIVNTIIFTIFQSKPDLGVKASFSLSNGFSFNCDANLNDAAVNATVTSGTIPVTAIAGLPAGAVVSSLSCAGGTCTATVTSGGVVIGTVTGTQTGSNFTGTYVASKSGIAPSGCVIHADPASPNAGGGVMLSVQCSAGTKPFSYSWSGCIQDPEDSSRCTKQTLPSGASSFSVAVSNTEGTVTATKSVTATKKYKLTIRKNKAVGNVWSTPSGVNCASSCTDISYEYPAGTSIVLHSGWPSDHRLVLPDCTVPVPGGCRMDMTEDKTFLMEFIEISAGTVMNSVVAVKAGSGSGVVSGGFSSDRIDCGNDCFASYPASWASSRVSFNAIPSQSSTFSNWTGCDSVDGTLCHVFLGGARTIAAYFSASEGGSGGGSAFGTFSISPSSIRHLPLQSGLMTPGVTYIPFSYVISGAEPGGTLVVNGQTIGALDSYGNGTWWRYYPGGCGNTANTNPPPAVTYPRTLSFSAFVNGTYLGSANLVCVAP